MVDKRVFGEKVSSCLIITFKGVLNTYLERKHLNIQSIGKRKATYISAILERRNS
jgi:hypothetical protein